MSHETFSQMIGTRAIGTLNLHIATSDLKLDFFVMLTSIASVAGNATQSAYSAGCAYQDAFAKWRRAQGLCATSFAFGLTLEAGYGAHSSKVQDVIRRIGMYGIRMNEFLALLEPAFLSHDTGEVDDETVSAPNLITGLEPSKLVQLFGNDMARNYNWPNLKSLSHVIQAVDNIARRAEGESATFAKGSAGQIEAAANASAATSWPDVASASAAVDVGQSVAGRLSKLLFISIDEIDLQSTFSRYGLDSMIAAELRTWLVKMFGLEISFLDLLDPDLKIQDLVDRLVECLSTPKEVKA